MFLLHRHVYRDTRRSAITDLQMEETMLSPVTLIDASSALVARVAVPFVAGARLVRVWRQRMHERDELMQLDARQLRDVGLDWDVVRAEVKKPFWLP